MDAGERETEKAYRRTKKRLTSIYTQAQTELERVLTEHTRKFERDDRVMRERMQKGEITPERYAEWQRLKVWQGEQWQHKLDNVTSVLANANTEALGIVNGQRLDVFEQNASFQQYRAAQAGISSAWNIYDSATVARLVEDDPQLLPKKQLDRKKDKAWNRRQVNNCITQGILQGESIPQIAKRIKEVTGSTNKAQMQRTARTAMTSAQNAGRQTAMEQQAAIGIRVQKMWIAAHDDRTRDAHGDLDGTKVDADKPFIAVNRDGSTCELQYPGDPHGDPEQVYNCRCTLGYVYPDYAKEQNLGQFESFAEWRAKHPKPERRRRGEESAEQEETPRRWATKEEYLQAKASRDSVYKEERRQAEQWYEEESDRILDTEYGGGFTSQRVAVRMDDSLTPEEKEAKIEEINRKQEEFRARRAELAQQRDQRITEAQERYDLTFDPDYEYNKVVGNPSIQERSSRVNPHYGEANEYSINCTRCALAMEYQMRGYDTQALAAPRGGLGAEAQYIHLFGKAEMSFDGTGHSNTELVRDKMYEWGDGARAIVVIERDYGRVSGHAFNVMMQDGQFFVVDGQDGLAFGDAELGSGVYGMALEEFGTTHVTLYRTDNKKMKAVPDNWIR